MKSLRDAGVALSGFGALALQYDTPNGHLLRIEHHTCDGSVHLHVTDDAEESTDLVLFAEGRESELLSVLTGMQDVDHARDPRRAHREAARRVARVHLPGRDPRGDREGIVTRPRDRRRLRGRRARSTLADGLRLLSVGRRRGAHAAAQPRGLDGLRALVPRARRRRDPARRDLRARHRGLVADPHRADRLSCARGRRRRARDRASRRRRRARSTSRRRSRRPRSRTSPTPRPVRRAGSSSTCTRTASSPRGSSSARRPRDTAPSSSRATRRCSAVAAPTSATASACRRAW